AEDLSVRGIKGGERRGAPVTQRVDAGNPLLEGEGEPGPDEERDEKEQWNDESTPSQERHGGILLTPARPGERRAECVHSSLPSSVTPRGRAGSVPQGELPPGARFRGFTRRAARRGVS